MSPPPVNYDFAAAEQFSQQLSQLAERLEWLIWLRQSQRRAWLGEPTSDNWSGGARNGFEMQYVAEQARLKAYAAEARRLKASVDQELADARAAKQAADKKFVDTFIRRPGGGT